MSPVRSPSATPRKRSKIILTEMNFRISSIIMTGALKYSTAFHSTQFKGVIAKSC